MELTLSCAWLAIVAWLIVRAWSQRGLFEPVEVAPPPEAGNAPDIAVIVPARNEEANLKRCLRCLIDQTYPAAKLQILVVDDHSTDATLAIAASLAEKNPQVCVLRSPQLPPRWIGKSHACWTGAKAARPAAEWLCFLDADVWSEPALLASAIAAAVAETLDLLSLAPRQQLESFAERLVLPCGLYLLAFRQDLEMVQSRHGDDATATGQFMLIRRQAYEAAGGHAAIRGAICEDVELARRLKRRGGHVVLRDGRKLAATRMYDGWRSLREGVSKNLVDMLGGPLPTVATAVAAVLLAWAAWLVPAVDAVRCAGSTTTACWALLPAAIGSAAAFGLHVAGASYFGVPFWYGFLFPLGYTAGAFMAIDSVRRRREGRVSWKGRTYP